MLKSIERRWLIRFPRTLSGWKKLAYLSASRCPKHGERLAPHTCGYGLCANGASQWPMGLKKALRSNYFNRPSLDIEVPT